MLRSRPFVAAMLVVLLAACGETADTTSTPASTPTPQPTPSDTPEPTPSPSPSSALDAESKELLAAVEATMAEGTVRIAQTIRFEGSSVIPDIEATADGQASFGKDRQMRLNADFTAFELGQMVMIRDGSLIYMSGPVFEQLAGPGNWLLVDIESDDPAAAPFTTLASGQNDVSMALLYFYGISGDAEVEDGEPIDGQATRHYTTEIDLEAARDRIPEDFTEALEDLIATMRVSGVPREIEGEAWVGEDGFVHRVRYAYQLGAASGGGTAITTIDFSDFGAPMDLGIPDDTIVVPIEEVDTGG